MVYIHVYFCSKFQSDNRIQEATIVVVCDPKEKKETGIQSSYTIIILLQVLKNNDCTLAVDDDSGLLCAEDTVVVVQMKQTDTSEKVLDEIASNIYQKVYSRAGVRAVPLGVLVSST